MNDEANKLAQHRLDTLEEKINELATSRLKKISEFTSLAVLFFTIIGGLYAAYDTVFLAKAREAAKDKSNAMALLQEKTNLLIDIDVELKKLSATITPSDFSNIALARNSSRFSLSKQAKEIILKYPEDVDIPTLLIISNERSIALDFAGARKLAQMAVKKTVLDKNDNYEIDARRFLANAYFQSREDKYQEQAREENRKAIELALKLPAPQKQSLLASIYGGWIFSELSLLNCTQAVLQYKNMKNKIIDAKFRGIVNPVTFQIHKTLTLNPFCNITDFQG